MLEEIDGSIADENIVYVDRAALDAHNEEMARLEAEVRELRKVDVWQPVEEETILKGYKDGFQVTVKPDMLLVETFWYWGEVPLPDNIRLCRKQEA